MGRLLFTLLLVSRITAASFGQDAQEQKAGFVSLFDGKTLSGWQGSTDGYIVENGAANADIIISSSPKRIAPIAASELQKYIKACTGATLPIQWGKVDGPAIVMGDFVVGLAREVKRRWPGMIVKLVGANTSYPAPEIVIPETTSGSWPMFETLMKRTDDEPASSSPKEMADGLTAMAGKSQTLPKPSPSPSS